MKKMILILSIMANIVFLIGISTYTLFKKDIAVTKEIKTPEHVQASNKKTYNIAILTPASHPSLEKIEQGFVNTLKEIGTAQYNFKTYNANGSKTLMHSQVEQIISKKYDAIFPIGAHAAQLTKEVTTKKNKLIPIVFGAVNDPVKLNLVSSLESPGNHTTGVVEVADYSTQLTLLTMLKPEINRILLVYNPSQGAGLEKDKTKIEAILKQRNIRLKAIEVYKTSEVYSKAMSSCQNTDAVLVLKDSTVVPAIDGLIKLCNRFHIPLMTTELESVEKGAVCGFGTYEFDCGKKGAILVKQILEEKKHPSTLACLKTDDFMLKLNRSALSKQGITLSPALKILLSQSYVEQE